MLTVASCSSAPPAPGTLAHNAYVQAQELTAACNRYHRDVERNGRSLMYPTSSGACCVDSFEYCRSLGNAFYRSALR